MPRLLLFIGILVAAPALHAQEFRAKEIDNIVRNALKHWQVPGVSVAIVRDKEVLYLQGYGDKELDKAGPVTADTVFPIGSCTKSFTCLAVSMLAEQDKISWDDPVRKHVPYFRLADPFADVGVALRDLACHRTGVSAHDLLWYKAPWPFKERLRRAGKLVPDAPFRTKFQYQVVLFGALGPALESAGGSKWQHIIQTRVLDPLDMKSASPVFAPAERDLAGPHRKASTGQVEKIARYPQEEPDAAGSIHASARDLANYLLFHLGDGTWKGIRLVQQESLAELHSPHMVLRKEGAALMVNPDTLLMSYGLGWIVQDYRGQLLLMHGGAIDGYRSHFTLVPKAKLGIALLNNLDHSPMNLALSNTLVDHLLGLPAKNWNQFLTDAHDALAAQEKERAKALRDRRKPNAKPQLGLSAYAGKFDNPAYGTMEIAHNMGKLHWRYRHWDVPLEYFEEEVFLVNNELLTDAPLEFQISRLKTADVFLFLGNPFQRQLR
ncbi:MAG: serine hydrolase [Gemmataceae bacterium]|nr:serine hydrolase [Gemmataceae bacterium]MCI0738197.1 serine hydrolase [Gemmataceae bacterium]